jgi:drug/metabolite transporter (DMT)-like permease
VKSGDRRWRFLSAILIVAGIVLIFVDSFSQEFSGGRATLLGLPLSAIGGAVMGGGIGLLIAFRRATKQPDTAKTDRPT